MNEPYFYKNKKIGVIDSEKRFINFKRQGTKEKKYLDGHIFLKYNSLGIEESVLDDLKSKNVKEIFIVFRKEDNTEELFKTSMGDWYLGLIWNDKNYGKQRHLTLERLRHITKGKE